MGDAVYQIALVWIMLEITNSNLTAGLVAMCAYLPAILFGVFSGTIADKYNRKKIMILSNICQGITVLLIPLLFYFDLKIGFLIGIIAFFRATFGSIFSPAMNSILPELIPTENLAKINSIIATSSQFSYLLGPAIASFSLSVVTIENLFIWDAISFIIAAFLMIKIPYHYTPQKKHNNYLKELLNGLSFLNSNHDIKSIFIITTLNNIFIMGPAIVGMPIFIKKFLNGTASNFAFIESGMAFGMILGSIFMFKFSKNFRTGSLLIFGLIWDGLTYAFFYFIETIPMAFIIIILHGIGIPMITISRTTILQKYTPNLYHGRLFSVVQFSVSGMTALSVALVGFFSEVLQINTLFLIFGIGGMISGIIGYLNSNIRRFK